MLHCVYRAKNAIGDAWNKQGRSAPQQSSQRPNSLKDRYMRAIRRLRPKRWQRLDGQSLDLPSDSRKVVRAASRSVAVRRDMLCGLWAALPAANVSKNIQRVLYGSSIQIIHYFSGVRADMNPMSAQSGQRSNYLWQRAAAVVRWSPPRAGSVDRVHTARTSKGRAAPPPIDEPPRHPWREVLTPDVVV